MLTRVLVARRQLRGQGRFEPRHGKESLSVYLDRLLDVLSGYLGGPLQLDHDPALILRAFDPETGEYTPRANDHRHLLYRDVIDHLRKTIGRTPGAEKTVTTKGSDIWLKKKFARLEGRAKKRPKQKIPGRPFPKGRTFPKPSRS